MQLITIREFLSGLCAIPEKDFQTGTIFEYLKEHRVEAKTLEPYFFFSKSHYTRNLIFRNELFELLVLCWEAGQMSPIHNHHDQNCWMAAAVGRLRIQNFRVLEQDQGTRSCRLEPVESFDIDEENPTEVDPREPVHQVLNLPEFEARAASLHIYSRPFDSCRVYSLTQHQYSEAPLHYSSRYGKREA